MINTSYGKQFLSPSAFSFLEVPLFVHAFFHPPPHKMGILLFFCLPQLTPMSFLMVTGMGVPTPPPHGGFREDTVFLVPALS